METMDGKKVKRAREGGAGEILTLNDEKPKTFRVGISKINKSLKKKRN